MNHFPKRIIFSIEPYRSDWLQNIPELRNDKQAHDEIIRQIFDIIDHEFPVFTSRLYNVPKWSNLVNGEVYLSTTDTRVRFVENTMKFGVGIYLELVSNGLFLNNSKLPYILESIQGDICLLYFAEGNICP